MYIDKVIEILKKNHKTFKKPVVTEISEERNPFKVLISCLLSLRTRDEVTGKASERLFNIADKPEEFLKLSSNKIESLIYPVSFYKVKAKRIKEICGVLINKHDSKVPDSLEELLKLKGVGRKTAGIVMCYGHNKTVSIPTDSHVHILSNRLGWVKTKTPEQTEQELMKIVPKKYWHDLNDLFVVFGQNICLSVSPLCSKCPINKYCPRIGVIKSR
ncbi:endonuclease III [Candidatus Woesearchaeota archaeon]|nr:endonuclease III [Candidatus Woesearchaeota archaeon]